MKRKILSILLVMVMAFSIFTNVHALTTFSGSYDDSIINISDLHTQAGNGYHYSIRDYNNSLIKSHMYGDDANNVTAGIIKYKDSENNTIFCAQLGVPYGKGMNSTNQVEYVGQGPACGLLKALNGEDVEYTVGEVKHQEPPATAETQTWKVNNKISVSDFKNFSNDTSYVKLQRAIWKYQNYTGACKDNSGNTITSYEDIQNKQRFNSIIVPSFPSILSTLELSSDGRYYEATFPYVKPILDESEYELHFNVEGVDGAIVEPSVLTIKVKVPVEEFKNNMSLKILITGKIMKAYVYSVYTPTLTVYEIENNTYQKMGTVGLREEKKYLSEDINEQRTITLNLPTGSLELEKLDSNNNGKKIAGAKFKLYVKKSGQFVDAMDHNGTKIPELVTDANGKIVVENLPYGDYKLEEIAAAPGYVYDEKNHYNQLFTIGDFNRKETIKVTNESIKISISKKDVANEKEVEGAKIVIYEYDNVKKQKGKVVKEFTSTKNSTEFYIEPGVYALEETVAPEAYKKVETLFVFEVKEDRSIKLLDTYSKKNIVASKHQITIYNETKPEPKPEPEQEVEVPDTGNKTTTLFVVIGSFLLVIGSAIIYFTIKRRNAQSI